ncbi:mycofactocin-coupled SDR family oxidoreductase [Rhodococcus sp. ACPA1]|uniref:mycofactocin-coupled SDR family oxidoreductase n=1 Tax=Rhodococcus sp. ACPA1 TaxID=2028572 RepID=UPI000BB15F92|nr:mycofactocin-coupled SDR family oxidoreductase [Rhodococcus sp. ACPA1]PBC47573.1 SDR family mycofactocin-dependent oxidoreductase [Rhodococcus sp. ACPA1]
MGMFTGKVALITGAARGQGRSHALRLAREGADILALDVAEDIDTCFFPLATQEDLDETVRLVEKAGGRIVAKKGDVRNYEDVCSLVDEGLEKFGPIGIISANAGIGSNYLKTWEIPEKDWKDVLDVNLTGVFNTVKAAVPSMIEAGKGGSITLTSSSAGLKGYENLAPYVSSKHGVIGLMRTLANELAPHSIRVNAVCPGSVRTKMIMNQPTFELFSPESPTEEDALKVFGQMPALPVDVLEPEDITEVIAFLASDAARYITGLAIPIDAGQLVK